MDDLQLADPMARRVGRFFADLMVTLAADDGTGPAESAASISTLWPTRTAGASPELDAETLVHGVGAVAIALADELVAVQRAAGAFGLTAVDVWEEVARALDPEPGQAETGSTVIDLS